MRIVFPVLEERAEVVYQMTHRKAKRAVSNGVDSVRAVRLPRVRRLNDGRNWKF